jgi:hypothetical protein
MKTPMFAGLFASSPCANRAFCLGVNKFTFCEVIDTAPKMRPAAVKSTVFHHQRPKPRIFEVKHLPQAHQMSLFISLAVLSVIVGLERLAPRFRRVNGKVPWRR